MKKQWLYFLLAFAVPVLGMLAWWGLLAAPTLEVMRVPARHYAGLEARGAYSGLVARQREVRAALERQHIAPGGEFTLILDDPRTTPRAARRARTGYLIAPEATPGGILQTGILPAGEKLVVRVRAHPLLAYGKAYSALLDYVGRHGLRFSLPVAEIYENSVLTLEMPLEVAP